MSKKQNYSQLLESALDELYKENQFFDDYSDDSDDYESSYENKPTNEWDFVDLQYAVDEYYNYPNINASEYDNVFSFWNAVDSQFDSFRENIAEYYGFSSADEFEKFIETFEETDEYVESSEWLLTQYIGYYLNDAMMEFPKAYEYPENTHYKCCVCGKPIEYSSNDSVMLTDDKWNKVIKYYHLQKYEEDAKKNINDVYRYYRIHGNISMEVPDDCHCFICNECMEKALKRHLMPDDLNNSPFNNE